MDRESAGTGSYLSGTARLSQNDVRPRFCPVYREMVRLLLERALLVEMHTDPDSQQRGACPGTRSSTRRDQRTLDHMARPEQRHRLQHLGAVVPTSSFALKIVIPQMCELRFQESG